MVEKLQAEVKNFSPRRSLTAVIIIVLASMVLTSFLPSEPVDGSFGLASCIPAFFLVIYIFITKRILEALTLASVIGFSMISDDILDTFSTSLTTNLMNEDTVWLIIVCGLMGGIIALIEKAGGAFAFGEWVGKRAKTRKTTLIWTWVLGIFIFIDDYLNSLTVGSCMAPVTDRHKVPREFLAYVVDSTAAPLCVIIPITTWSAFCGKLLEINGWAPEGEGLTYFIKTIPFNFYAWIAAILVPLVVLGIVPIFGPMKKAEERVANGGPLAPPGSEKIDIKAGEDTTEIPDNPKLINFFLPILVLIGATIYFDVDMQMGVLSTLVFMFVFYLAQNIVTAEEFADLILVGIRNMILPLMLMVLAFVFGDANDQIGFTYYVINSATRFMTPELMPFIIFIVLAFTEFITGTNWGMYIIALPIVIPLATIIGANMPLSIAAVLSAGVLGSHICFYSDATILTSAATGCNNFNHALTQAPFGIFAGIISAVMFLIAGFIV